MKIGTYPLARDASASTRLTAQHYLWKDTLKFNLHPDIPLPPTAKIADVATGNGLWMLDLAQDVPHTINFEGFDISLDQCPPVAWLPDNIMVHTWNFYDEPPSRFIEAFDVVHIRLVTIAVQDNDPRPILTKLQLLLKPGGYLQWDEIDTINWVVKSVDQSLHTEAVRDVYQQICGTDDWKNTMVQTMNEVGFSNTILHRFEYNQRMARLWNDVAISTWGEFIRVTLAVSEESQALGLEAMRQVRSGSALHVPIIVWVTQRA